MITELTVNSVQLNSGWCDPVAHGWAAHNQGGLMANLTKTQQAAIEALRKEGLDFIAGASERFWSNGQQYYIDARVPVSKPTRNLFIRANKEVKR